MKRAPRPQTPSRRRTHARAQGGALGAALLAGLAALSARCAGTPERFALRAPMQRDDDARPFAPAPAHYRTWETAVWIDSAFINPVSRVLAVDVPGPAVDVNALDEVPDSSWFTNRWPTPERVAEGPCRELPVGDPDEGWTVTEAKQDGITMGFFARDPAGRRYLVKFDVRPQRFPELSTTADAVASRLYWAAGYNAPCNEVVFLDPSRLRVEQGARTTDARGEHPMAAADLQDMLRVVPRGEGGRVRATASRLVPGTPLGQWRYTGTRDDDPNDVVAHEDRRELRAGRVIAAWLNHYDAREQNTLDAFVQDRDARAGHVVHYLIDFGDCLGTPEGRGIRFYDAREFDVDRWRTGFANPAFVRARREDEAWMARVLSRLSPAHIHAAMGAARASLEARIEPVIVGRWRAVLARYLRGGDALGELRLRDGATLCAVDLPRRAGVGPQGGVDYSARGVSPPGVSIEVRSDRGATLCADLRSLPRAPDGELADDAPARYRVVELRARDIVGASAAVRAHLYDLGPARGFALVGLER